MRFRVEAVVVVILAVIGAEAWSGRALAADGPAADAQPGAVPAAAAPQAEALAASPQFGQPGSIQMASRSIRDWRPDGEKGIWILARNGMWFYGAFDFPCDGLPFENSVGFLDGTTDELDKFGGIATRHAGKCKFKSFVTSAGPPPPPPKKKPAAKGATAAAPAPTPDVQAAPAESAPVPATDQGV